MQDISQVLVRLCHSSAAPGCTPMPFPHLVIKVTALSSHQLALPGPVPLSAFGMALHMVLVVLSLLPLLEAQNPEPANITLGIPITNETLKWVSACLGPGPDHCRCLFSLWAFLSLSVFLSGLPVLLFPLLGIVVASPCLQTQKHHSEVSRQGTEP